MVSALATMAFTLINILVRVSRVIIHAQLVRFLLRYVIRVIKMLILTSLLVPVMLGTSGTI